MITLQEKIKDLEVYISKSEGFNEHKIDIPIYLTDFMSDSITLADLIKVATENNIDYSNINLDLRVTYDFEDYPNVDLRLFYLKEETDEEYFDRLCSSVNPTRYQQEEYAIYLQLKAKYG